MGYRRCGQGRQPGRGRAQRRQTKQTSLPPAPLLALQPGTSGRRQEAGQEVDLAGPAAQPRRRQRPAESLIDLTGGDDDEENWQPRPAKRHWAERRQQQQRDPWGPDGWEVDGLEWAAAAAAAGPIAQPLQQRHRQGALQSPQLLDDSPKPQVQREQQQQQQQQQQPERPPAQQEEQRRQDVQQEAAGQAEEPQAQQVRQSAVGQ